MYYYFFTTYVGLGVAMNKIALRIAASIAPLAALTMGTAQAGALTNTQIFSQFNAVISGNFTSSADVEGRTVVGGNLTGGATFELNPAGTAMSSFSALTVYGSSTGGGNYNIINSSGLTIIGTNNATITMAAGGTVYIGGANSGAITANNGPTSIAINGNNNANLTLNGGGGGTIQVNGNSTGNISGGALTYTGTRSGNLNGGATATHVGSLTLTPPSSTVSPFATTFQALSTLSTQLNAVKANSTAASSGGAITFNAAPVNGVAVFDVNTALFAANSTVTINLDGATSVIVNVSVSGCVTGPCAFTMPNSVNFNSPTGYAATVLWNFINATNLTFTNEFGGSVLAPLAAVRNSSPIDGTLVAASYSGTGELHSHPYTGSFPGTSTPAPEPASLAVIGTALAGLATVRRKRKPKAPPLAAP
jgi:choice-of-anchor A domain-containing protein